MVAYRTTRKRPGLAPLEFVMALPILLFVTALIVNIGTMATWRVRGEVVSRDAVWRSRWPRTGDRESPPSTWPANARMQLGKERQIAKLDHPDMHHSVVRGPLPNGFQVTRILAPDRGCKKGESEVTREYPLLPRLGPYESGDIKSPLLDEKWPCSEMGIPNVYRRSKRLYVLPPTDQSLPFALAQATSSMFSIPHYAGLFVLDRDIDILTYRGHYVDFHPRIRHPYPRNRLVDLKYCQLDPDTVHEEQVTRLTDTVDDRGRVHLGRISRLPRTLTNFFLRMYRDEISWLEAQVTAWQAELAGLPPTAWQRRRELRQLIAETNAELARLRPHIAPLEAYENRLPQIEDRLRGQVS